MAHNVQCSWRTARGGFWLTKHDKILVDVLRGTSDNNIRFQDLCRVVRKIGFDERVKGSHHIFTKEGVEEILNLQPTRGLAKPYQVKQVRSVLLKYRLGGTENGD